MITCTLHILIDGGIYYLNKQECSFKPKEKRKKMEEDGGEDEKERKKSHQHYQNQ